MQKTEKINLMGVNIDNIGKNDLLDKILTLIKSDKQHYLVTPNPEILLNALRDEELFYILNHATLAPADGFGLVLAGLFIGKKITRITGADITLELLSLAAKQKIKIGIFNWRHGLSNKEEIAAALKQKFPDLKFVIEDIEREWNLPYYQSFNIFQPKIIFVALGSPWQEKFLYYALKKMPYLKFGLAVGGSFDYLTKKAIRAPKIFRKLGWEWLWRLYQQPNRAKRILTATIIFPYKFFLYHYWQRFFYRPATMCLLYKKTDQTYKILLVKRNEQETHWQLPQGGREGETIQGAGIRELAEELNVQKVKPQAIYKNIYKYKFSNRKNIKHFGYKGQKISLLIAKFYGSDNEIKINWWDHKSWQWVDIDKFLTTIHPLRRESGKIALALFHKYVKNK